MAFNVDSIMIPIIVPRPLDDGTGKPWLIIAAAIAAAYWLFKRKRGK